MKKVLIITYYWPPSGGIGVLRCLKFAKYLRTFGWEPIIFTASNANYPSLDPTNNKDIPSNITVIKLKIWEPYGIYKLITGKNKSANVNNVFYTKEEKPGLAHEISVWIRSNFFIPDARSCWINPSVKFLLKYIKSNPVDAILSNGPPHTNSRIATIIKKKTRIPWLADFQDPWSQIDYFSLLKLTSWSLKKHLKLEQEVFKYSDHITIVSPKWKHDLESIGAKNVTVIPWGFDQDDFKDLRHIKSSKFVISHLGILGYDRRPETFFKAILELKEEESDFEQKISIVLPGQVDFSVQEIIEKNGLNKYVNILGNINRKDALKLMKNSNILLLLLNQQENSKGRIPGKLFEYLACKRPVLCLGDIDGDSAKIITDARAGYVSTYNDLISIKSMILKEFRRFKKGENQKDVISDIDKFSVERTTEDLAKLLTSIIK